MLDGRVTTTVNQKSSQAASAPPTRRLVPGGLSQALPLSGNQWALRKWTYVTRSDMLGVIAGLEFTWGLERQMRQIGAQFSGLATLEKPSDGCPLRSRLKILGSGTRRGAPSSDFPPSAGAPPCTSSCAAAPHTGAAPLGMHPDMSRRTPVLGSAPARTALAPTEGGVSLFSARPVPARPLCLPSTFTMQRRPLPDPVSGATTSQT